jgi:hypothetical protein
MLREAQQRAQDRTHTGRHLAAIQLDGVCEHAMMLAVGERGGNPGKSFHGNFEFLKNALGGWPADGWSGVNRLHGTRTEAQHRGTVPDPVEFSRWSADTERFVNSLVAAVFNVDLQTVATGQAVETDAVREHLERAAAELADENFNASYSASMDALKEARQRWNAERSDALGPTAHAPPSMQSITEKHVSQAVARMEELGAIQPFAPDLGEYIWLRKLGQLAWRGGPVTRDDAERAFAFVVGWTLRWEAFSHRYAKDRWDERFRGKKPETTTDADAKPSVRVLNAVPQGGSRPGEGMATWVSFKVVDIPDDGAQFWLQELNAQLSAQAQTAELGARLLSADNAGIVGAHRVGDEAEAKRIATAIEAAVNLAHDRWQTSLSEVEASYMDLEAIEARFAAAVTNISFEGKPLVVETKASGRLAGSGADRRFAANVAMTLPLESDSVEWHQFWRALHRSGGPASGGDGPLDLTGRTLVTPATMAPQRLREVLLALVENVEAERQAGRAEQALAEARADAVAEAARAELSGS